MSHYSFSINLLLLSLCVLPFTAFADDNLKEISLTKNKLRCLYGQTESLLKEGSDPVIVVLTNNCHQASNNLVDEEHIRLPNYDPKIDSLKPTLKLEDVLILTRLQLRCFKLEFDRLKNYTQEPVPVKFTESCTQNSENK